MSDEEVLRQTDYLQYVRYQRRDKVHLVRCPICDKWTDEDEAPEDAELIDESRVATHIESHDWGELIAARIRNRQREEREQLTLAAFQAVDPTSEANLSTRRESVL